MLQYIICVLTSIKSVNEFMFLILFMKSCLFHLIDEKRDRLLCKHTDTDTELRTNTASISFEFITNTT